MMGLFEIILIIATGTVGGFGALILLGITAAVIGGVMGGILSGSSYAYMEHKEHLTLRQSPT